jgi:hypothetical protein
VRHYPPSERIDMYYMQIDMIQLLRTYRCNPMVVCPRTKCMRSYVSMESDNLTLLTRACLLLKINIVVVRLVMSFILMSAAIYYLNT